MSATAVICGKPTFPGETYAAGFYVSKQTKNKENAAKRMPPTETHPTA